jgi:diguanylate cyclase (GGDEF)-like protein
MRIIDAVSAPWESHGRQMRTTVSVGVVVYPDHGDTAAALLRNVDMALYQVKGAGRNHFQLYDPHLSMGEADPFLSATFEI